jgi:hypothetical protein
VTYGAFFRIRQSNLELVDDFFALLCRNGHGRDGFALSRGWVSHLVQEGLRHEVFAEAELSHYISGDSRDLHLVIIAKTLPRP